MVNYNTKLSFIELTGALMSLVIPPDFIPILIMMALPVDIVFRLRFYH